MKAAHRALNPALGAQVPSGLCALAIMTKAPLAGKVKTRLSPPLRADEAASLNICFLRDTAASIAESASGGRSHGVGVYTPVGAESAYDEILPPAFELVPQRGDAFGERLIFAIEDLLALGFESACLINSDSPTVPRDAFSQAVELLAQDGDRMVIGPSDDGGYYLIGLKKLHRRLFEEIDWSTERVLRQTKERAAEINLEVKQLPTWYDVDDLGTLSRLCAELFGSNEQSMTRNEIAAPETRKFLADILDREGRDRIWPNEPKVGSIPLLLSS